MTTAEVRPDVIWRTIIAYICYSYQGPEAVEHWIIETESSVILGTCVQLIPSYVLRCDSIQWRPITDQSSEELPFLCVRVLSHFMRLSKFNPGFQGWGQRGSTIGRRVINTASSNPLLDIYTPHKSYTYKDRQLTTTETPICRHKGTFMTRKLSGTRIGSNIEFLTPTQFPVFDGVVALLDFFGRGILFLRRMEGWRYRWPLMSQWVRCGKCPIAVSRESGFGWWIWLVSRCRYRWSKFQILWVTLKLVVHSFAGWKGQSLTIFIAFEGTLNHDSD